MTSFVDEQFDAFKSATIVGAVPSFSACPNPDQTYMTPDFDNIYSVPSDMKKNIDISLFYTSLINRPVKIEIATFATFFGDTPLNIQTHSIPAKDQLKSIDDTFTYSNGFFVPDFAPTGSYVVKATFSGKDMKQPISEEGGLADDSKTIELGCFICHFSI